MRTNAWLRVVLVVAMILTGGALLALAEEGNAESRVDKRVVVNVNDTVETIGLEDLADGETREFEAGDHTVTVTRTGDKLDVRLDGDEVLGEMPGSLGIETMVWVGDEDEAEPGTERVFVMKGAGDANGEVGTYTIRTREDGGDHITVDVEAVAAGDLADLEGLGAVANAETMIVTSADHGSHPVVFAGHGPHGDMVRYRCEESGSELLVPRDDALLESYICPATGCLMTRVEEPDVHVVKIVTKRTSDDQKAN